MRKNKEITIAGAGLSGLTAAINLVRAGYEVKIYEKNDFIGQQKEETVQLLPNWFAKQDVLKELEDCGIKLNWLNKIEEIAIHLGSNRQVVFYSKKIPTGYTVLRGGDNSLEIYLAKQAETEGVEVMLGRECPGQPDIVATGVGKILTVGYARVYEGDFQANKTSVFFNSQHTPSVGYGYLFPHNNKKATFKISKQAGEAADIKKALKDIQKQHLSQELKEENFLYDFGTKRSFDIPETAIKEKSLITGEAAGFQDELFRFGMRYAVISGYLAAQAIIRDLDYDALWKERFLNEFKKIAKTRKIFCCFKKGKFGFLPKGLKLRMEIRMFKKLYLSSMFNLFLRLF